MEEVTKEHTGLNLTLPLNINSLCETKLEPDTPTATPKTNDTTGMGHADTDSIAIICPTAQSDHNSSASSSSTICRICQDGEDELGNRLRPTGCACSGSIRMIHEHCLLEWVRSKRSIICELCHCPFGRPDRLVQDACQYRQLRQREGDDMQYYLNDGERTYAIDRYCPSWMKGLFPYCENSQRCWIICVVFTLALSLVTAYMEYSHTRRVHIELSEKYEKHILHISDTNSSPSWLRGLTDFGPGSGANLARLSGDPPPRPRVKRSSPIIMEPEAELKTNNIIKHLGKHVGDIDRVRKIRTKTKKAKEGEENWRGFIKGRKPMKEEIVWEEDVADSYTAYMTSIVVLCFTSVIMAGVLTLWLVAEYCLWPLEKFLAMEIRFISWQREMLPRPRGAAEDAD